MDLAEFGTPPERRARVRGGRSGDAGVGRGEGLWPFYHNHDPSGYFPPFSIIIVIIIIIFYLEVS